MHADCINVTASVGQNQNLLTCNIPTCPAGQFQWRFENNTLPGDSDSMYTVNVTTVAEFGGKKYECQCDEMSRCFIILGEFFCIIIIHTLPSTADDTAHSKKQMVDNIITTHFLHDFLSCITILCL